MAVAFGTELESIRTGVEDPYTFTFTPGAQPRAIVIAAVHGVSSTDHVVGITYGGRALTRIIRATDTATEPGAAELWFLGANIPGGAQTVSADLASATTDDIHFVVWSLTANYDCQVIDSDSIAEDAANPTRALQKGGRQAWCVAAMYGGAAAPGGTLATGCTLSHTHDLTAFYSQSCYETTPGTADFTIGWSTLGSDDLAFVALAVAEIEPTAIGSGRGAFPGQPHEWRRRRLPSPARDPFPTPSQQFPQELTAIVTTAATMVRSAGKIISATAATSATMTRQVGKTVSATVATVATMIRQVGKTLTATVATVASITAIRVILVTLTATVATSATMLRQVGKSVTASVVSTSATITRQVAKTISATVATVASLTAIKVIIVNITATVGTAATMVRRTNKSVSVSVATAASMVRQVAKTLTSTVATSATMTRTKTVVAALAATVGTAATMTRQVGKAVVATVGTTATMTRQIAKTLVATVGSTASLIASPIIAGAVQVLGYFGIQPRGNVSSSPQSDDFDPPNPIGRVD